MHREFQDTYGIELRQIPPFRKMSTQARLRAAPGYAAEGPEHTGRAENSHPRRSGGNTWRETVENHSDVVEDVCC